MAQNTGRDPAGGRVACCPPARAPACSPHCLRSTPPSCAASRVPAPLHVRAQIFCYLDSINSEYTVKCSYLELYNEEITDLLVPGGGAEAAKVGAAGWRGREPGGRPGWRGSIEGGKVHNGGYK